MLGNRKVLDPLAEAKRRLSLIDPGGKDNTCLARAMVLGAFLAKRDLNGYASWAACDQSGDKAVANSHKYWMMLCNKSRGLLHKQALALHRKAGVPVGDPLPLDTLAKYCDALEDSQGDCFRVLVYEEGSSRPVYSCGKPTATPIYLVHIESHVMLASKPKLLFSTKRFCKKCDVAYNGAAPLHRCDASQCALCRNPSCASGVANADEWWKENRAAAPIYCENCAFRFRTAQCMSVHMAAAKCDKMAVCPVCYKAVAKKKLPPALHLCGQRWVFENLKF